MRWKILGYPKQDCDLSSIYFMMRYDKCLYYTDYTDVGFFRCFSARDVHFLERRARRAVPTEPSSSAAQLFGAEELL